MRLLLSVMFFASFAAPFAAHASPLRTPFPYAFSSLRPGGGHHGHRTDMLGASAVFLLENGERDPACALRWSIGPDAGAATTAHVAETLAMLTGSDERTMYIRLTYPPACAAYDAARSPVPGKPHLSQAIPFPVGADGKPVSSNALWNRCIAQPTNVPLPLIRSNTDRTAANARGTLTRPKTCGDYFLGGDRWRHPDFPGLEFVFRPKPLPTVWVPAPYVIVRR